jgi:hypothetical protein
MEDEVWKDIENYEGLYQVSNLGNVRSLDRVINSCYNSKQLIKGKVKVQELKNDGYMRVTLHKDGKGKHHYVHRLVAEAFIPNPDDLPQVNHKDENKTNNNVDNLEWCTNEYNHTYGTINKRISESQINDPQKSKKVYQYTLDGQLVKVWASTKECGRNGYPSRCISNCCLGKQKQHQGFRWLYDNISSGCNV